MKLSAALLWCLAVAAVAPLPAQDIIYYKFESGGGTSVINYAHDEPSVPREGAVWTSPSGPTLEEPWGPGVYGGGFAPGSRPWVGAEIDTGWDHSVTGDLTVAFFVRVIHPLPAGDGGILCGGAANRGPGGITMSISNISGRVGYVGFSWRPGSGSQSVDLQRNIYSLAFTRWVHIAINIDRSARVARWYVDGIPEIPQAIGVWNNIAGASNHFNIGQWDDSYYAFDEFRVSLRNVPAAEVLSWAQDELAAHGAFGTACHPFGRNVLLDGTSGGLPALGNANYALAVYGLPQSSAVLLLGASNQSLSGISLPLDLGAVFPELNGCFLRSSAEAALPGTVGPTGALAFPLPIPDAPRLVGTVLYSQALLTSSILSTTMLTNAYASSIGN